MQKAILILGLWTLYGLYASWQTHYRSSFTRMPYSWPSALTAEMSYAYLWALATPLVMWVCRRSKFDGRRWAVPVLVHLFAMLLISSAVKLCWDAFVFTTVNITPLYARTAIQLMNVLRSLNGALDIGVTAYFLIAGSWHAVEFYRRYQVKQREALALERELAQAELRALKMQLNPHFLFNTLHAISALVADSPKEAEKMIARLSMMLRSSLDQSGQQEVTLEQELRFLDLYLDIEQMRFRDRLQVRIELDPEAANALVPNMLLQPLVENSIRHGIERMSRPGVIEILAQRTGDQLRIQVIDNGCNEDAKESDGFGVGLRSTRGRLERLYGSRQSLVLRRRAEGGVEAEVLLPYQEAPARTEAAAVA